jgi:hypothetical protein
LNCCRPPTILSPECSLVIFLRCVSAHLGNGSKSKKEIFAQFARLLLDPSTTTGVSDHAEPSSLPPERCTPDQSTSQFCRGSGPLHRARFRVVVGARFVLLRVREHFESYLAGLTPLLKPAEIGASAPVTPLRLAKIFSQSKLPRRTGFWPKFELLSRWERCILSRTRHIRLVTA